LAASEEAAFEAIYDAEAHPFVGTVRDALLMSDLQAWRESLTRRQLPGDVILGGGRAAELRLHLEAARDGWTAEVRLRHSGDDPWPELRYQVLRVAPFIEASLVAVRELLGEHS
jgi:hypothetical protein